MFTVRAIKYALRMRSRLTPTRFHSSQQAGAPAFLWWLVGAMALIELSLSAAEAGIVGSPDWRVISFAFGAFWQPLLFGEVAPVFRGQTVAMFITYAFLHGSMLHLALNGVVILALGKMISDRIGAGKTLVILFLSAVGGAGAFGLISASSGPMIGASGAAFGLLGVWQCWDYGIRKKRRMPVQPVLASIFALIVVNVLLFIFLDGGLAWEAHLGGWLAGFVAAMTFAKVNTTGSPR